MPFVRLSDVSRLAFLLATVSAVGPITQALAKDKEYGDPNWPCISRKVAEISPAQIWDGPGLDAATEWQNDDEIRKLSAYLIARRLKLEDVEAAIKKYADGLATEKRDAKLTELFAGVLSRSNDDRKLVMSGIERFHKRQLELAKKIEATGAIVPDAKEGSTNPTAVAESAAAAAEPAEQDTTAGEAKTAQEKYRWDVRIFQERAQNLPLACEVPGLIEERAGAIARAIRALMKS